jgi:endonuclease YncB( thermonuclease family)
MGLATGVPVAMAAPLCPADRVDEKVQVAYVYDGDTVRLSDGRKLRLIGLDAPEVGHRGEPSAGGSLGMRYDAERRDQYGRELAHLYLSDGSDVAAEILAAGLASTLAIPPNLWNQSCFAAQEQAARQAQRGVWKLRPYRGVESKDLAADSSGFHRVFGRVSRVGESKKSLWLNLEGGLAVRVPREDLTYFGELDLHSLSGRRIEVRGRIYSDGGRRLQLTLQHPSALALLP